MDNYVKISNHLAGELDIRSALRAVSGEIEKIIAYDHLDVCLIDQDGLWNTSYEVGLRTSWSSSRSLVAASPVRSILNGETDTMLTGDALIDPRYVFPGSVSEPMVKHGLRSRINVAMKVFGRTAGALNFSLRQPDHYNESHVPTVQNLADILAPYFFALRANENAKKEAVERTKIAAQQEGLRLGALRLTDALERERQRIGMDLHDQTLADLTRISRALRPGLTLDETAQLQGEFQGCIQQLRRIIETSVPSILELFGFEEAVRSHFESVRGPDQKTTLSFVDSTHGSMSDLGETERIALFRICQEAINNSLKHAEASQLNVTIDESDDKRVRVRIADNGQFDDAGRTRQSGLQHMRTRAKLIGASFKIEKSSGSTITVLMSRSNQEETVL
ncbi:sensor histidine kinase [Devosia beringensis]|uniref:sensor histidine kinase n=1 Tax=Devosia beringensis TaxID=2657486 RepID=UPI001AEEB826|nr:ATP-binding protein [Devosia beringensis]